MERITRGDFCKGIVLLLLVPYEPFRREEAEPMLNSSFLLYHEVSYYHLKNTLLGLIGQGYQPISLETLIRCLDSKQKVPQGLPTFLVTFDDGRLSQYEQGLKALEEVENETGWFVPSLFFVMTKFEDLPLPIEAIPEETPCYNDGIHQYLTKGQLIELIKRGHWVDNHTVNHPNLLNPNLSELARNADIIEGQRRIQTLWKIAGRKKTYEAFAYPFGQFRGLEDLIKSTGYHVAFSTQPTTEHSVLTRYSLGRVREIR